MNLAPGSVIAGALAVSLGFPLLLVCFAHGPLRVRRSGVRFRVAAGGAIVLFVLWCLVIRGRATSADVVAGGMMISGALLLWFNIWSVLVWGFTLSMLTTLAEAGQALTQTQWIAAFTGTPDASAFAHDRLNLLLALRMVKVASNRVQITPVGRLIAVGARVARRFYGLQ